MGVVQQWRFETLQQRQLFSLALGTPSDLPRALDVDSVHFICLVAWDAKGISTEIVSNFVERLLEYGAVYFVCWGPDCERVHDIVDEITALPGKGYPEDSCIMTTWHAHESLAEALWFFLACAAPDSHYESTTSASLAISIGSEAWNAELVAALQDPSGFIRRAARRDAT